MLMMLALRALLWAAAPAAAGKSATPWLSTVPEPRRIRYAAPEKKGDGSSPEKPTSLARAIDDARPGDEIRLLSGSYEGEFTFTDGGAPEHPVVLRNAPGAWPKITGSVHVGDGVGSVWIWGLEVTYAAPAAEKGDDCIELKGPDNRAINNYLHDCTWNGIGAWRSNKRPAPGQIVYGNLIVRSDHAIYAQNRFEDEGYKYFVNNVILDVKLAPGARKTCCYAFHGYTERGDVSGIDVREGIFTETFLIGGQNLPNHHLVVRDSLFYASFATIGYRRPTQVTFVGNTIARGRTSFNDWWGAEEAQHKRPGPSVVTDNEFYNVPGDAPGHFRNMEIRTSAYVPDPAKPGRFVLQEKTPRLPADDVFDRNLYSDPPNSLNWWVGGQEQCCGGTFAKWREVVALAGNASFDANSRVVPAPTTPKVVVHPNAYDSSRIHVGIVNWGSRGPASVNVVLPAGTFAPGTPYEVRRVRDFSGEPVARGKYDGAAIPVPVDGEFDAFVILATAAAS